MTTHSRRFARQCREHFGEPQKEAPKPAEGAETSGDAVPEQADSTDQPEPG